MALPPAKKPVREKYVLQPEQIPRLLAMLEDPVRTMVLLAILTGLRIGEILGLRRKDLDFTRGQIRVEQACYRGLMGSPKTQASKRTVPMPEVLRVALTPFYGAGQDSLVFHTRSGKPCSDTNLLHRHLQPAGRQLGLLGLSWHVFRRTHATLLQHAGASLRETQAQLGHTKMSTTLEIYTLPIAAAQRQAVERLARLVTNGDECSQSEKKLWETDPPIQ